MSTPRSDQIRENVLRQMDSDARVKRVAILGAAMLESLMLVAVLLVMDWSDETHILVFLLSILGYTVLVLGLVALGAHLSRTIGQLAGALRIDAQSKE